MLRLEFECEFDNKKEAEIIYNAIVPDIRTKHKRSTISLKLQGNKIICKIDASDATALRASFNGIAQHMLLSKKTIDEFKGV